MLLGSMPDYLLTYNNITDYYEIKFELYKPNISIESFFVFYVSGTVKESSLIRKGFGLDRLVSTNRSTNALLDLLSP